MKKVVDNQNSLFNQDENKIQNSFDRRNIRNEECEALHEISS